MFVSWTYVDFWIEVCLYVVCLFIYFPLADGELYMYICIEWVIIA